MSAHRPSRPRRGILAGGNWIVDHVKVIDTWPPQDALASILGQTASNGGAPYNVLKDLARLGAPFPLAGVGLVGRDVDGRAIRADCAACGIDVRRLRMTRLAATSSTDVMTVQSTGRRTFFHQRGANALLDAGDFDFAASRARIFHLGYLLLLDRLDGADRGRPRVCRVLAAARRQGLKTSIDVVSEDSRRYRRVVLPALPFVDYCFANDFEAERLTGVRLRSRRGIVAAAAERAARRLLAAGVREWVFIHFAEAVLAAHAGGGCWWQPSVRVRPADIRGAAGAGDALAAGILFGLHEGWPITRCLRLGVAAAAASLSHPTCSEGVGTAAACLAQAGRRGFRRLPGMNRRVAGARRRFAPAP